MNRIRNNITRSTRSLQYLQTLIRLQCALSDKHWVSARSECRRGVGYYSRTITAIGTIILLSIDLIWQTIIKSKWIHQRTWGDVLYDEIISELKNMKTQNNKSQDVIQSSKVTWALTFDEFNFINYYSKDNSHFSFSHQTCIARDL